MLNRHPAANTHFSGVCVTFCKYVMCRVIEQVSVNFRILK